MAEPLGEFLRRGQVEAWLEDCGIRRRETRTMIEEKVIKIEPLPGKPKGSKGYARKSQIKEALKL
jgi:hypothetical protein